MRDQANWLLGNIIPIHVAEQLKVTQSYSKNHDNVGVIFASIVNFSEFYEESYEGGKECYRVLNELIGDFDELLRKPEFSKVEKIKTIGATYMAASGLSVQQVDDGEAAHPHAHLRALFDFALEMMGVLDDFNKNMLGFGFRLRIGFNHGPLTAGVIGTTKLLYDIWGDTVNIASRMDSTGVECRVQVSEESHAALSAMGLEFDYRGTVNVKGKGQMRTFLCPKSGDRTPGDGGHRLDAGGDGNGAPPREEAANATAQPVAKATHASPTSSLHNPSSSASTLLPPPRQRSSSGIPAAGAGGRRGDEGYRDAPDPSHHTRPLTDPLHDTLPDPGLEPGLTQEPSGAASCVPLAHQEEDEDEEEEGADERTKLNEEFCERL
ncbi:adenylate cyclase type 9 [Aplochiton taeniatus]